MAGIEGLTHLSQSEMGHWLEMGLSGINIMDPSFLAVEIFREESSVT